MTNPRRKILKSTPERAICAVVNIFVILIYFFELLVVLPKIYGNDYPTSRLVHISAGKFYK